MKLRRTMLYVPGNSAAMVKDAHIYRPDTVMFDLEDSVSCAEKDAARFLVYQALKTLDYEGVETAVRINALDTPYGKDDIAAMVRAKPGILRIPKTETAQDVSDVEELVEAAEKRNGLPEGAIKLFAAVESPLGVLNAYSIATSSKRLVGIAVGAEDLVTSLKTFRSPEGTEIFFARSQVLYAARAAGINAVDTVFSDIADEEGFLREVKLIKQLGFDGKSVIQPNQIGLVHRVFTPAPKEIAKALRVIAAIGDAERRGSGVIALDGKMIDKPIVERAERTLELARASGIDVDKEYGNADQRDK